MHAGNKKTGIKELFSWNKTLNSKTKLMMIDYTVGKQGENLDEQCPKYR
jgi:hypothetical protein